MLGLLARRAGIRPTELLDGIYSLRNCDAARHLYRVTSGLESMIVGEAEVQGQVKRAYEAALAARTTGPMTNKLFRAALATGKRVRTETAISARPRERRLRRRRRRARGARRPRRAPRGDHRRGRDGRADRAGAARPGRDDDVRRQPPARARDRAGASASAATSASFDALPAELERADIVVSSTSSPHALIGAEELAHVVRARGGRPLLLLDLAVPRDIEPDCGELPGVTLLDIDALQAQVARRISVRQAEARRAEGIVEEEIQTFAGWLGSLEVLPTLTALRAPATTWWPRCWPRTPAAGRP